MNQGLSPKSTYIKRRFSPTKESDTWFGSASTLAKKSSLFTHFLCISVYSFFIPYTVLTYTCQRSFRHALGDSISERNWPLLYMACAHTFEAACLLNIEPEKKHTIEAYASSLGKAIKPWHPLENEEAHTFKYQDTQQLMAGFSTLVKKNA